MTAPARLRPEAEILECVARPEVDAPTRARLEPLFEQPIDWRWVVAAAIAHGVTPLAHRHLASVAPERAATRMKEEVERVALRTGMLTAQLAQVHSVLSEDGIEAVPFKGPVLATQLYGSASLRPSNDLDLMIRPAEVGRARELLVDTAGLTGGPNRHLSRYVAYTNELGLIGGDAVVELQWAAAPRYMAMRLDLAPMWRRLGRVELSSASYPTFSGTDLLLLLLAHGAKHRWERLIWVADIALLSRWTIDWERLMGVAELAGMRRIVLSALGLARLTLGLRLPTKVASSLERDPTATALAGELRARMHRLPGPTALPLTSLDLRLREDPRDRATMVLRSALTTTRGDWEALPEPLIFLAPIIRPFRLATRWPRGERQVRIGAGTEPNSR